MKREDVKNLEETIQLYVNSKPELNIDPKKLNSDIRKLISVDDAIANLITTKNEFNKLCLAHRVDHNMCFSEDINKRIAIESHTVADNQLKKILNAKHKLLSAHVSIKSILDNQHPTELKELGAPSASTFVGFCNDGKSCENKFERIDDINNFPLNHDDYLMFLYRDLGKRIVCMESTIQAYHERINDFNAVEDFFKFSIESFSFDDWIKGIQRQLIDTKNTFIFFYNEIYNKNNSVIKTQNDFIIKNIETNIDGFAIGTSLRYIIKEDDNSELINKYLHYHFWIDTNNKQRVQIFCPNIPELEHFFDANINEEILFFLFIYAVLDSFHNLFFKENKNIKINELMNEIYLHDIRNDSHPEKIINFITHLEEKLIITYCNINII
jgi:hypothetical protein